MERRVATYEFSPAFQGWVTSTINRFRRVATAEYFASFSIVATRRTIISCALVQAMNDLPKINRRSATKSIALRNVQTPEPAKRGAEMNIR